ncbi:MAG: hypothetical protein QNK03_01860 [Myxococcota bacterium]|nr:hypothetical protein [Myxococcota bacterium]
MEPTRSADRRLLRIAAAAAAVLGLAAAPAAAQPDLRIDFFGVDLVPVAGTEAGYRVDSEALRMSGTLRVSIQLAAQRADFDAAFSLRAVGSAPCNATAASAAAPPECVYDVATLRVLASQISTRAPLSPPVPIGLDLAISPPGADAFDTWAAAQFAQGRSLRPHVRVDPSGELGELPIQTINNAAFPSGESQVRLVPLSGRLELGAVELAVNDVQFGGLGCFGAELDVSAGNLGWTPGSGWNPQTLLPDALDMLCVEPVANAEGLYDLVVRSGSLQDDSVTGVLGGLGTTVGEIVLAPSGVTIERAVVALPLDHSVHPGTTRPRPAGAFTIELDAVTVPPSGDFTDLAFDQSFDASNSRFLRSEWLPFSLRLTSLHVGSGGATGTYDFVHYVYDLPVDPEDPRPGDNGFRTNQSRFRVPEVPDGDRPFALDENGLDALVDFRSENGWLTFPKAGYGWAPFTAEIQDGRLAHRQRLPMDSGVSAMFLRQLPDCGSCVQPPDEIDFFFGFGPVAGVGLAEDGAYMADAQTISRDPAWGPVDPGSGRRIFERQGSDTAGGVIYAPGFIALETGGPGDEPVPAYLLGARQAVVHDGQITPGAFHALGSVESDRGNHFLAGINAGPELYHGPTRAQPVIGLGNDLTGTITRIGFGGPGRAVFSDVVSNVGTKYVVREDGVTGAFNTATAPPVDAYGFPLQLSRFGFRQVSNLVDPFTWVDGMVRVPGKGGFEIAFESLGIECEGALEGGFVVDEPCNGADDNGNGLVDENCDEALAAWQTPYEVLAMSFEEIAPVPACEVGDRALQTAGFATVHALDDDLVIAAQWSSQGEPVLARAIGELDFVLDHPDVAPDSREAEGFPIALSGDLELKSASRPGGAVGWFEAADTHLLLPFWNSIDTDLRVQNRDLDRPEASIVVKPDSLPAFSNQGSPPRPVDQMTNQEIAPLLATTAAAYHRAAYQWGGIDFQIDVPIYYEPSRYDLGRKPGFLGQTEFTDLGVVKASAAANYVRPSDTKISFGLSADLARLSELAAPLHVDLRDPESIAELDAFLAEAFNITGNPVDAYVGLAQEKLDELAELGGIGFDAFLRRQLVDALPIGPFDDAAGALAVVHGIPAQAAQTLAGQLTSAAEDVTTAFTDPLDDVVVDLYQTLPEAIVVARAGGGFPPPVAEQLNRVIDAVDVGKAGVRSLETALSSSLGEFNSLRTNVTGPLALAVQALETAKGTIDGLALQSCGPDNAILGQVAEVRGRVQEVIDAVDDSQVLDLLGPVSSVLGLDSRRIDDAVSEFETKVDEMVLVVDDVLIPRVEQALACGGSAGVDVGDAADTAVALIDAYIAELGEVESQLLAILARILLDENGDGVPEGGVAVSLLTALRDSELVLDGVRSIVIEIQGGQLYGSLTADQIRDRWDTQLENRSNGRYRWFYPTPAPHGVIAEMRANLLDAIDQDIAAVGASVDDLFAALRARIPAGLTGADLRLFVVDEILNQPAVELLLARVHAELDLVLSIVLNVAMAAFDSVAAVVQALLDSVEGLDSAALAVDSDGNVVSMPSVVFKRLDGYGIVTGNELERIHALATWTLDGNVPESVIRFEAALDIEPYDTDGRDEGCAQASAQSWLDARISAEGIHLFGVDILQNLLQLKQLYFGVTLNGKAPVGGFGGMALGTGAKDPKTGSVLNDFSIAAVFNPLEQYGTGHFDAIFNDSVQLELAGLFGRTCDVKPLSDVDPQVGEFIELPNGYFDGGYLRGGVSIPIIDFGCPLRVSAAVDVGGWGMAGPPIVAGGLIGGGVHGKIACLAAIRGQVTVLGQVVDEEFQFRGEAFVVGGIGFDCDPHTWTSVRRSRRDSWCATGDAAFGATYKDGWDVGSPKASAIH